MSSALLLTTPFLFDARLAEMVTWVSSGTASHAAMATSPSSASMLRNTSEKDMGNGNGDVHKVLITSYQFSNVISHYPN
jgi:hypothetical protein